MGRLDERVKELVDELLKRREDPALKEIREIVSKALGYSHEAISGTTTAGLVEMLARGCKDMQDHGILGELHREFDRAEPRYPGGVIERARRAVDDLLKLRQQGETNNSCLTEDDRREMRRQMSAALGKPDDPGTLTRTLVEQVVTQLTEAQAQVAELARKNSELHARLGAKGAELAELQQKHQELYSNYKLLQALSNGQPKGLAPEKEKWHVAASIFPDANGAKFRVMRGNEDATPHPVSKAVAEAIAWELNTRGGS